MNIIQRNYSPVIRPGLVGMIGDHVESSTITRLCETATGIPFGRAVSQGTGDRGAVIGGSGFIGLSVRDITQSGIAIDPTATVRPAVDLYPQYANMEVITRGHLWVLPQGNVIADAAAYFDATTGLISGSASGAAANGYIIFNRQPVADETIIINGKTVTFKGSGASGNQSNIGATLGDTILNLANSLVATVDTDLDDLTYAAYPLPPAGGGVGANTLLVSDKTVGTGGNSVALNAGTLGSAVTLSGATLAGGTASATLISGARWVTSSIAGGLALLSLSMQY
jgi:hypothetical protein